MTRNASRAAKKARQEEQAKKDANDRDITEYFTKGAAKTQPKAKVRSASTFTVIYNY